jgi:alkylation response protein AidB-like acyl-CoA dehydrogenase
MFELSHELRELRDTLRRFLSERAPMSEVRRLMATEEGYEPAVWHQLAGRLGVAGLGIPEALGGSGFGPLEQMVAMAEMGRALLCSPYFASAVLAANALLLCGDRAAQRELLPGVADGTTIATLAVPEQDGAWHTGRLRTRATRRGGGYVLTGRKHFVPDGHIASLLLVAAQAEGGPGLFAVAGDAPGLSRRQAGTGDMTRRRAVVEFSRSPARPLGRAGAAPAVIERTVHRAAAALAAEQAGGARRCLEMSLEHARQRHQFGQPIGRFQAIMHQCADMALDVESAWSAAHYAALAAQAEAGGGDAGPGGLALAASLAAICCSEAYLRVAAGNIQINGGAGFTCDHDAHLYYQRALSSQTLIGGPHHHRAAAAARLTAHAPRPARGAPSPASGSSQPATVTPPL